MAEILITLTILGVVAVMAIPALVNSSNEAKTVSGLRAAYSILSQAYRLAVDNNGTPENWQLGSSSTGAVNILNNLAPYLKISKMCGASPGCFPSSGYKNPNGSSSDNVDSGSNYAKAMLANGLLIATLSYANCNGSAGTDKSVQSQCGQIYVDVNGFNLPNMWGKDFFCFYISKDGIVPFGSYYDTTWSFSNSCADKTHAQGCAAWVIFNENMEYWKCDDLSWDGKHRCGG